MRNIAVVSMLFFFLLLPLISRSEADQPARLWSKLCGSCHDGKTAPDKEWLREKYKTTDEFAAAVKGNGGRCMNILKNDNKLARKIAEEIGIKSSQGK